MPFTLAIFLIFVVAFAGYLVDSKWQPDLKSGGTHHVSDGACVNGRSCNSSLLMTHRHRTILVLLWAVGLAVLLRASTGFYRELPYEAMRYNIPPAHLVAADLSDQNWDRGVHRGKPGFFARIRVR